jgi:proline-specific peptidase
MMCAMHPPPNSERWVPFDGRRTFVRVAGELAGRAQEPAPLLALHGRPPSHEALEPLLHLAETGRPVVLYDQQGCGRSDPRPDALVATIDEFVDELHAVRIELELDRVHLLGHSWGGVVALAYALRQPPGLVSLTLASTYASRALLVAEGERLVDELPDDVRDAIRQHEAAGTTDDPAYQAADAFFFRCHICRLEPLPDCLVRARTRPATGRVDNEHWDVMARLGEVAVPTLVTCGRHDFCTPTQARAIAAGIPGSELTVFEESAHYAHLEEAERYVAVLGAFLDRVDRGVVALDLG